MERFYIFQSLQGAKLQVGGGEAQGGWENSESRLAITVMTESHSTENYQRKKEQVEVQVWLTIPQVAMLVVAFFKRILPLGGIYRSFLRRLLEKRWAHMTSPICKRKTFKDDGWIIEPYAKA